LLRFFPLKYLKDILRGCCFAYAGSTEGRAASIAVRSKQPFLKYLKDILRGRKARSKKHEIVKYSIL
jgi:hypothetical protein